MKFSGNIILLVFTIFMSLQQCESDAYNSIHSLQELLHFHLDYLEKHQQNGNLQFNTNRSFLVDSCLFGSRTMEISRVDAIIKEAVQHPITAYASIKCLLQLKRFLQDNVVLRSDLKHLENINEEDHRGVGMSLVRLQETYNLNVDDLLNGKVMHFTSLVNLTVQDCLLMAHEAFNSLKLESTETWIRSCKSLTKDFESRSQINELQVSLMWLRKLLKNRNIKEDTKMIQNLFPNINHDAILQLKEPKKLSELKRRLNHNTKLLCQGFKNESDLMADNCILQRQPFSWAPNLIENIYKDPKIVLYHKVISDSEIKVIKTLAKKKLVASQTHRFNDGKIDVSSRRVGKMAWLSPQSSYTLDKVYQRIQRILGLSIDSAEELQVQNYGIGGHYEVHMDFFDSHAKELNMSTGDRIATFLIYMNDVVHGGATAFPQLGVAVKPKRGSALMWYNLKHNGLGDYRTLHAACPVLIGTKWVANVWLHEHGQEFLKPCDTINT